MIKAFFLDFYGTVEKEVDIDCGAGSVTLNLEGKVDNIRYWRSGEYVRD